MAEILTIAGTDRTALLFGDTLKIEQAAAEFAAVCSFQLTDRTGTTLSVTKGDEVVVTDDSTSPATTLFSGEVTNVRDAMLDVGHPGRRIQVECQDWNVLIEEILVYAPATFTDDADAAVIGNMFTTYCPAVDASTHVSLLSNITITFEPCTLRRALERVCELTGGRWYIDAEKKLHYFDAESNVAAWYLSDSPDLATSFPYQSITRNENATPLYNYVLVQGKELSEWYHDAASAALYGARSALLTDQRIEDVGTLNKRGAAFLAKWAWPRVSYDVVTRKTGLLAGMDVRLVCSTWGVDDTLTVRRLTIYWQGGQRFYRLELGDGVAPALTGGRVVMDAITGLQGQVLEIDDTVFDTTPPATPSFVAGNLSSGVDVDADGHQVVYLQITWGSVADDDLSYYQVQLSTASDFAGYTITRSHPADGDRLERFLPVLGNTLYYARVRAVDWVGNASAWSATRSITTARDTDAPAQVAGLSVAASRTLMGLQWTANGEADLAEYEIQRAPDSGGAPGAYAALAKARLNFYIDQAFSDAQIAAEGTWWYRVRAVDTSGNAGDWSAADSDALSRVKADHIAAAAITAVHVGANEIITNAANIANAVITSAKIVNLDGIVITGNTIRTAASGARIVLDSTDGIQAYNAGGDQTVSILPSGAGYIGASDKIAWNTAGSVSVDGSVLVAGTVVATAFTNAIGQPRFSAANGLLLLGPYSEQTASMWRSSRGQALGIAGAAQWQQGHWTGTRGLEIVPGTTNLVPNPVLGGTYSSGVAPGWTKGGAAEALVCTESDRFKLYGDKCQFLTFLVSGGGWPLFYCSPALANSTTYTWQAWVYVESLTTAVRVVASLGTGSTHTDLTTRGFHHVTMTATTAASGSDFSFQIATPDNTVAEVYVLGAQVEAKGYATPLAAGSFGSGFAWSGTTYNSATVRTGTAPGLSVSGVMPSAQGTVAMWFKVHDLNADGSVLWCAGDASTEFDAWITAAGAIRFYTNTGMACSGGTVVPETWHRAVFTWDVAGSEQKLYLDGEIVDTGSDGVEPTRGVYLGVGYSVVLASAIYNLNGVVGEFATFGSVWDAEDVAADWALNRPLVDAGATDKPGVYIADGRFRLYSSTTGARTEIDVEGIKAMSSASQTVWIKTTGDALFGSNVAAPATTALAVFATAQTYNAESLGAGDVLFGDNSASKANMLWDASDGLLRFRGGTTTQVYIATDGSLRAGGGAIKISSAANVLFSVADANQGLSWFSDSNFSTVSGYIGVAKTSGVMTIASGGPSWVTAPDMRFDLVNSTAGGTTWTAIYIDAGDVEVRVNGASGGSLSCRNNNDGAWPAFYAHQNYQVNRAVAHFDQDHESAPIIRLDGPWSAATEKSLGGYFKANINGTDRWIPYYV